MSEQGISDFDDFWGLGCDKGVPGDAAEPTPLKLRAAADAIAAADFLLIAAGAGFSAQSGLPVYKDLADVLAYKDRGLDYADLAQPHWRHSEPGVFFGFMGNCSNMYQAAKPHDGYRILRSWCNRLGENSYVYTSNVDGFFQREGFEAVNEMHGCMQRLLCVHCGERCTISPEARYTVDTDTLQAPDEPNPQLPGGQNHPKCPQCSHTMRPEVVLFKDDEIKPHLGNIQAAAARYQTWEKAMEESVVAGKSVVILELGCGIRVPSVRKECEEVAGDLAEPLAEEQRQQVTFVRVNPDYPLVTVEGSGDDRAVGVAMPMRMDALSFLNEVDSLLPASISDNCQ